jgi:hypothetical protein
MITGNFTTSRLGNAMIKETELKYTVNTLVELSRNLWGDNSTDFLAGALQSVITEKQMKVLIDDLERQVKEKVTQ